LYFLVTYFNFINYFENIVFTLYMAAVTDNSVYIGYTIRFMWKAHVLLVSACVFKNMLTI